MPTWNPLSLPASFADPTLVRTKDGVLHAAGRAAGKLLYLSLGKDGKLAGPPSAIGSDWGPSLSAPWLMTGPDGPLTVMFSTKEGLRTGTSKDGGKTWEVGQPTAFPPLFAAAADKTGKPVPLSAAGGVIKLHAGATPEVVRDGPCCVDRLALALDFESAEGWAVWRESSGGLFSKAVKPSTGMPQRAPGARLVPAQRLAVAARIGGPGVYLAFLGGYPVAREVKLWNVRGGEAFTIAKGTGVRQPWIASAPDGRVWILWSSAANSVSAIRSNKALTAFSRPYLLGRPSAAARVRHLVADGSTGPLDVLANGLHTRLLPQLEVSVSDKGVMVSDLGDPVEGVEVQIEGKTLKTNAKGIAEHPIAANASPAVKATHPAYAPAQAPKRPSVKPN